MQIILTFVLGVWTSLLLLFWSGSSHFGSKVSIMNMRLGTLLIVTFILCVLAMLGEVSYSISNIGKEDPGIGPFIALARLAGLIGLYFWSVYTSGPRQHIN